MTRKDCFRILELKEGATLDEVKSAYRKLAFALHPDLNPDKPDAPLRFNRLNEAYVMLTKELSAAGSAKRTTSSGTHAKADTTKAREEAQKAYNKAHAQQKKEHTSKTENSQQHFKEPSKEDLLNDILKDEFARRVFEDIYRHVKEDPNASKTQSRPAANTGKSQTKNTTAKPAQKKTVRKAKTDQSNGMVGKLSGWFRKQIDDEQTITLPRNSLVPGAKVRLQIQHGLMGEVQTIEIVLPEEFAFDKPIRLKGLGKRLGNWKGDLYVRINPS